MQLKALTAKEPPDTFINLHSKLLGLKLHIEVAK